MSCSCCGNGCGEVKCPFIIKDGNFEDYIQQKNSCLEKVNGHFQLKKTHSYYFQVQQQLFSVPNVKYCDFVVCAIDKMKNIHLVVQFIYPDIEHWNRVLPKYFGQYAFSVRFWGNGILDVAQCQLNYQIRMPPVSVEWKEMKRAFYAVMRNDLRNLLRLLWVLTQNQVWLVQGRKELKSKQQKQH